MTNQTRKTAWPSPVMTAIIDIILLNVSFVLAYIVRYKWEIGGNVEAADFLSLRDYVPVEIAVTVIVMFVLASERLYRQRRGTPWLDRLGLIARGTLVGITVVLFVYLIFRPTLPSRLFFAYLWLIAVFVLGGARLVVGALQSWQRRRGIGVERVLIVGAGQVGRAVIQNILARPELGYLLVGFVDDDPAKQQDMGRTRAFGPTDNVVQVVEAEHIDQVIITLPWVSHTKVLNIMAHCQRSQVSFRIVPDLFQLSLSEVDIDDINGIPLIGVTSVTISEGARLVKRVMDIIVSTIALLITSPLLAVVTLLVRLDSPGPIFFRQTRIGRHGQPFTVYKFRTMRIGAEEELPALADLNDVKGITFKIRQDPRRTRVGGVLRRWSIDELPQFFNVLRGDMSVIGPRPPLPSEVERYEEWHRRRLEVAPGITGLWQVMGRSELPFAEMVMMDIYYIENWSLALDFKILLQTGPTVLSGRGAY